jgi:hypothetical protein
MTDSAIEVLFKEELLPRERLMWVGRPDHHAYFNRADLFLVPFSIAWAGLAIGLFVISIVGDSQNYARTVLGGVFSVIGLYLLVGRIFVRRRRRRTTFYAVSNLRALTMRRTRRGNLIQTTDIVDTPVVLTYMRPSGVGTILFGGAPWEPALADSGLEPLAGIATLSSPAFIDIPGADAVYRTIQQIRGEQQEPSSG